MHRREFDYGLHHDGGYLFSRVVFRNYFALGSAMAGDVLDQLDSVPPSLALALSLYGYLPKENILMTPSGTIPSGIYLQK
jgi:hypothetical protein